MTKQNGKLLVSLWLHPAAIDELNKAAREMGLSRTDYIKRALGRSNPKLKRFWLNRNIYADDFKGFTYE